MTNEWRNSLVLPIKILMSRFDSIFNIIQQKCVKFLVFIKFLKQKCLIDNFQMPQY